MEDIRDKIYDIYYSENSDECVENLREKIHWVTQNVHGIDILDVGCSKGIVPILLGREGKRVLGVDVSTPAIEEANKNLLKEEEEVQELVTFERGNFFLKEFKKQYDTVILGGVLEHIKDVNNFFEKAVSTTKQNGRLIVTTSFGINEFPDYKRTFYLYDFIKYQDFGVVIEDIKFFGKWIGIKYIKSNEIDKVKLNDDLFRSFEKALKYMERNYITKLYQQDKEMELLKEELKKIPKLQEEIEKLKVFKEKFIQEKIEKTYVKKELLEVYNNEAILINERRELSRQYEQLLHRYNNIRNSTLGKLTLKYWKWRSKRSK